MTVMRMRTVTLVQAAARLADRVLSPREATRNAAAAAYEIGLHNAEWREAQPRTGLPGQRPAPAPDTVGHGAR